MDRVLDRLWIGATEDFRAPLAALGFVGLLDLRDGAGLATPGGVTVHRADLRDGDPYNAAHVVAALDFVAERIQYGRVLIACAAGMSRSACMTIGYLVKHGFSVPEAFEAVRAARPRIAPQARTLDSVLQAVCR